jgi:hypothetical protein
MSLALMLLSHAGAWLLAAALQSRLRTGSSATDLVGTFILHALVVTLIVLALGGFRVLGLAGLSTAGFACLATGIALGGHRVVQRAARWLSATAGELRTDAMAVLSVTLIGAVVIRHLANLWYFTPATYDEVDYHLPKLVLWMQTGGLARPDSIDLRTYFPSGQQLLQAWWVGFLHHDVVIEAASLEWTIAGGAAVASIARRMGFGRPAALLAAALFLTTPASMLHGATAGNDMAASACVLAIAAFLLNAPIFSTSGGLALATLFLGCGIKPTVGFAAIGLSLIGYRAWHTRSKEPDPPRRLLFAIATLAALAGSYWYFINWAEFGNPFFPVPVSLFGQSTHVGLLTQTISTGPSLARLTGSVADLFGARLFTVPRDWQITLYQDAGWGFLLPLAGLGTLLWFVWKRTEWRGPAAAFAFALLTTLLLVERDAWNARFLIWFPALFAVALARLAELRCTIPVAALLLAVAAGHAWETRVPSTFRGEHGANLAALPWRDRTLAVILHKKASATEWECIRSMDGAAVLAYNYGIYTLTHSDFGRRVEQTSIADPGLLLSFMQKRNLRYLVAVNVPILAEQLATLVAQGKLRVICPGWLERVE